MIPDEMENSPAVAVNPFTAANVAGILQARGWAVAELPAEQTAWCEHAAAILGTQAADRDGGAGRHAGVSPLPRRSGGHGAEGRWP